MNNNEKQCELMTNKEVQEWLKISKRTLENWSLKEGFPKKLKMENSVRYRRSDIQDWINRTIDGTDAI
ncbi:MAG: helix-turn-helix domain-containing protein [Planctomycetia bacterium]|nr:helix-turn-helix domain-containing protein [Planctomycetia bacterium]